MTKEEQINWLRLLKADLSNGIIFTPWNKEFIEALTGILDQEPCDDCTTLSTRDVVNVEDIENLPSVTPKSNIGHCKDCKYFEYDSFVKIDGLSLICAHEICKKWGDRCKTSEDGYCFLFESKEKR